MRIAERFNREDACRQALQLMNSAIAERSIVNMCFGERISFMNLSLAALRSWRMAMRSTSMCTGDELYFNCGDGDERHFNLIT